MDSHPIAPQIPESSTVTLAGNALDLLSFCKLDDPLVNQRAEKPSHYENHLKGFELLALAATFTAAVQTQVMASTMGIGRDAETAALTVINSLYLAGFAFNITSALLAFLTARWLQCLTMDERSYFETTFEASDKLYLRRSRTSGRLRDVEQGLSARPNPDCCQSSISSKEVEHAFNTPTLVHFFFAYTLFVPMSLLITGFLFMSIGLLVFAWTEHSLPVGIVLTVVYLILLPFSIGVFMIGRNPETRLAVIYALSKREGNW
ncbi:hypothetical protein C0995_003539 [Termitomyces sp. Mi166|nr:hypothetical protein C0995_003539 [Termitomyces sp. Mi166\